MTARIGGEPDMDVYRPAIEAMSSRDALSARSVPLYQPRHGRVARPRYRRHVEDAVEVARSRMLVVLSLTIVAVGVALAFLFMAARVAS